MNLTYPTQGPTCLQDYEHPGYCGHESCRRIDRELAPALYNDLGFCEKHGYQNVTESGSNPGFCAGSVYWANLACGCQYAEDCSYLES